MSSREQFEAWYLENWGHTEDDHETLFERCPDSDEEYYRLGVRMGHQAWQAATSAMEAKCAALAAENAALKEDYRTTPALRSKGWPKSPATDAFIAEQRAQAWNEGGDPAEFGRYWVRYETDVGPQYCSAQWLEHNFCSSSDTNIHKIWLADHSHSINNLKGVTHYTRLPEPIEGGAK